MKTVYLNDRISPVARKRLESKVHIVDNFEHPEKIDVIFVRQQYCTKDMIKKAVNCKLIQMHGVGLERIDLSTAKEAGIPVSNTPGMNAQSVAELTVGFIIALSRKLTYINDGVRKGKFQKFGLPETEGNEVSGKKLGLVGSGHIAQRVAKIMRDAFQNEILVYNPHLDSAKCNELGFQKIDSLEELFHLSDIISIHVPFTESTKHMINKNIFEHANKNLLLVNTARGGIVDENALYEALVTNKIKAAAMDVFEQQPVTCENPLLNLDNFISTLHIGGSTEEALDRIGEICVDHIFEVLGIEE